MPILKAFLQEAQPRFVVAYGKPTWGKCNELFEVESWQPVQHTRWDVGISLEGIIVSRVGFFGNGQFNRQQDLPRVAEHMVKLAGAPLKLHLPA
jgi:hypothetical protein